MKKNSPKNNSGSIKTRAKKISAFEKAARHVTQFTGHSTALIIAVSLIIIWAATGPIFGFSDTWQLVINTGTTIITFLMVFIIQHSQNKDTLALQLKLNELIYSMRDANNELVDAEELGEEDLKSLRAHYEKISKITGRDTEELPKVKKKNTK